MTNFYRIGVVVLLGALLAGCGSKAETTAETSTTSASPATSASRGERTPLPASANVPENVQSQGGPPPQARK